MVEYMKRKIDENEKANMLLALCILGIIGGLAAVGYHLLDSLSRWPSSFIGL